MSAIDTLVMRWWLESMWPGRTVGGAPGEIAEKARDAGISKQAMHKRVKAHERDVPHEEAVKRAAKWPRRG